MIDKNRAKKMLIVTLVIGICILTAGISGRVIMGRITDKVTSASFIESMNNEAPELSNIINRSMGRLTIKLFVSLIKNDSTGFINAINDVAKSIGSIADSSGIGSLLLSPFFEESARTAFQEARRQLVESTGAYMPLLQFTAYYSELLIIGGVVSSASLLLWFLVGGKKSDIWGNKAPFVIGMIWIVIIFIMTIIVLNVTGDILDTESIESSQSPQYDYSSIDTSNSYIAEDIDLEQTENEAVVSTYYNEEATVEEVTAAAERVEEARELVKIGHYEQDYFLSNGKEDIEWIVLDYSDNKALLISRYILCPYKYDSIPANDDAWSSSYVSSTWKDSSLREWLNTEFYYGAFSSQERETILLSHVDNSNIQGAENYNITYTDPSTDDYIFVLSPSEVKKYLKNESDCRCQPTDYAINKGCFISNTFGGWWLRSRVDEPVGQINRIFVNIVNVAGITTCSPSNWGEKEYGFVGVRPAMWVDLQRVYNLQ